MTAEAPKPPPSFRDLEEVMARSLKQAEPAETYRSLRLQPVVLPPPPTHEEQPQQAVDPVSAEDDIEPDHSAEIKRSRTVKFLMAGVLAIAAIGSGLWAYQRGESRNTAAVPEIKASPEASTKAVVVPQTPSQAATAAATPAAISGETSMGQISTELVPPTTDGLSPARRITTIRIIVENDREVQTLR